MEKLIEYEIAVKLFKLSAYEEIGLSPGDIKVLKAKCKELEELLVDSDNRLRTANTKLHKIEEVLADGGN